MCSDSMIRANLESLDTRRLLSAASLVDGIVTITTGDGNQLVSVYVTRGVDGSGNISDESESVLAIGVSDAAGGSSVVFREQFTGQFSKIRINAAGEDRIVVADEAVGRVEVGTTNDEPSQGSPIQSDLSLGVMDPQSPGKYLRYSEFRERYLSADAG